MVCTSEVNGHSVMRWLVGPDEMWISACGCREGLSKTPVAVRPG